MLDRRSPQRELSRPDHVYLEHVGPDSFYGLLSRRGVVLSETYGRILERSVEACRRAGPLKGQRLEVALDTTPVPGRRAVKETFNLISEQIRVVVEEVCAL